MKREKIGHLLERLDRSLLERGLHVRLALLALLAGHHVLLLGPPGTAKSLLARALCRCIAGTSYFEYLLSKFTHPDELFGPVSIPGLEQEDYRRLTEGYLPRAHVAFLDEMEYRGPGCNDWPNRGRRARNPGAARAGHGVAGARAARAAAAPRAGALATLLFAIVRPEMELLAM